MAARTAPRERVLTRGMLPAYAAAWLPIVGAYVIGIVATGVSAIDATVSAVLTVAAAAGLGVPALEGAAALAHRRPVDGGHAHVRLLALHGARAAAYATAWVATTVAQMVAFAPAEATQRYLARSAPWEWVSGLFLYGVLAAVGHAVAVGRQLREREAAASRAELHALRAQLDPHFLFNTLHSLVALARRDPAAVERGLETFGAMLRYVLDGNRRGGARGSPPPATPSTTTSRCPTSWRSSATTWRWSGCASATGCGWRSRSTTRRSSAWSRRSRCSRWSRTRSATASRRARRAGRSAWWRPSTPRARSRSRWPTTASAATRPSRTAPAVSGSRSCGGASRPASGARCDWRPSQRPARGSACGSRSRPSCRQCGRPVVSGSASAPRGASAS
jgi:hypothetical protein